MTARDRRLLAAAERLARALIDERRACGAYTLTRDLAPSERSRLMDAAIRAQRAAMVEAGHATEEIIRTARLRGRWRTDDGEREV
jgi:hypothetical protein